MVSNQSVEAFPVLNVSRLKVEDNLLGDIPLLISFPLNFATEERHRDALDPPDTEIEFVASIEVLHLTTF